METLNLSNNRICGVAGLTTSPKLATLDLSNNNISEVEHFEQVKCTGPSTQNVPLAFVALTDTILFSTSTTVIFLLAVSS